MTANAASPLFSGLRLSLFSGLFAGLLLGTSASAQAVAGPGAVKRLADNATYCDGRLDGGLVGMAAYHDRETLVQLIITVTLTNKTSSTLNYKLMLPGNESSSTPLGSAVSGPISANQSLGPLGLVKIGGLRQLSDADTAFNRYKQMLRVRCN